MEKKSIQTVIYHQKEVNDATSEHVHHQLK